MKGPTKLSKPLQCNGHPGPYIKWISYLTILPLPIILESMASYCGGLRPRLFSPLGNLCHFVPFKETCLGPELFSPPRFRIQGGYRERHTQRRRTSIRTS